MDCFEDDILPISHVDKKVWNKRKMNIRTRERGLAGM
jgi:hypothetical protein